MGKTKTNNKSMERSEKKHKKDLSTQQSKSTSKVTFRLSKEAAPGARTVSVVGDFNKWNIAEKKMKKLKNGDFTLTLELPCDREFSFRYLIDTDQWEKDWFADKHIPEEHKQVQ
jgi:1,4-alpha-glucan branching enzyme